MADLTPEQQQAEYVAIELLYSEGKWAEVLQASETLLASLPAQADHPLRARLGLVIGHTLLYGREDVNGAEARYQAVLQETQEPVVREIAELGLSLCVKQRRINAAALEPEPPPAADGAAAEPEPAQEITRPPAPQEANRAITRPEPVTAAAPATPAAMPWDGGAGPAPTAAGGDAMPWLSDLGAAAAAPPAEVPGPDPFVAPAPAAVSTPEPEPTPAVAASAPEPVVEPLPPPVAEPTAVGGSAPEPMAAAPAVMAESPMESPVAAEPAPEATEVEQTLALLREPEELIPVTIQVLDEPRTPPEAEAAAPAPPPVADDPPLSPAEMAELARGLLEVVLR